MLAVRGVVTGMPMLFHCDENQKSKDSVSAGHVMPDKKKQKSSSKPKAEKQSKKRTKKALYAHLARETGLTSADITCVMKELERVIAGDLAENGSGEFTLPGLLKMTTVTRPAVRSRTGINPFTGEKTVFKARPATRTVKIRSLKKLKEFANS